MEQKNLMNSTYRRKIDNVQTSVNAELISENNIAKVLCAKADSVVDSFEALNGELRFSGTVCYSVTYTNEMGEFFTIKTSEPFSGKVENETLSISSVPIFKSEVVELLISSVTSEEIKLSSIVETTVDALITDNVNYYVNNNEDIITNSNFVNFTELVSHGTLSFNYEEQLDVKNNVVKVLFTNANVCLSNYSLGTDYFTVEGVISVNIGYETGEEEKILCHETKTYKFKEELEKEGLEKDGKLLLTSFINNCDIKAEIVDGAIKFTLPINVHYYYLKNRSSEVVVDAFSLKNKLNLNISSFNVSDKCAFKCSTERVDGSLVLDEDKPRILKIVGYCGENVSVTNSYIEDDKLITEGVAGVSVIYLEDDDNEVLNSVIAEVPFSVESGLEDLDQNMSITTSAKITDVSVKGKKGREFNIDLELCLTTDGFSSSEEMALTGVEEGEPLTAKEACLQIYFARKGNTLWEISKGLQTRPEQILEQNPNLNLPLEADEKIVLFKQK